MTLNYFLFIENKQFFIIIEAKYEATYGNPSKLTIKLSENGVTKVSQDGILKSVRLGEDYFSVGDKVLFARGYGNDLQNRFVGYIESVEDGNPITIIAFDKLHHIGKESISTQELVGLTDKQIIEQIFVSSQTNYTNDLGQITLNWNVQSSVNYNNIPTNISKRLLMKALEINGHWKYYMGFDNNLYIEKPYTRAKRNVNPKSAENNYITENDIVIDGYDIEDKDAEKVNVRLYSVNTSSMKITSTSDYDSDSDFVEGYKLVEKTYKDLDGGQLIERKETVKNEYLFSTIKGKFIITGGVNGSTISIFPGDTLDLVYKGRKIPVKVEKVEEIVNIKDKIRQTIHLQSVASEI